MSERIDNTVICQYRPRADKVDELMDLIREHRSTYTELGLATGRPEEVYIGEDQDGAGPLIVAIFQWVDAEAPGRAHQHPTDRRVVGEDGHPRRGPCDGAGMAFPHFDVKETL